MSWDASFYVNIDGSDVLVYETNYTHNCNGMIRRAGFEDWWDGLVGMSGAESAERLTSVLRELVSDPSTYEAMDPPNGWGSLATLIPVLLEMRDVAAKHPCGRWEVWG